MPQILLTGQLKEKPTYRVWCLYSSFVHEIQERLQNRWAFCEGIKSGNKHMGYIQYSYRTWISVLNTQGTSPALWRRMVFMMRGSELRHLLQIVYPLSKASSEENLHLYFPEDYTVIRTVWVSAKFKFGTSTVVSVFGKCLIYTHDVASAKFST
jgi:hypothetical protein